MGNFFWSFILLAMSNLVHAQTVLVLGDSISAAYGLESISHGWVAMLQDKVRPLGIAIVNASVSGETSAGGLSRLGALLERHRPAVLILELGANDGLRGLSPKQMEANLGQLIVRSKAAGATVLLLGMQLPPNYGKRYADLFKNVYADLAELHEVPLVPFVLEGVGGQNQLMQGDGLHPNGAAQEVILGLVWEKLGRILGHEVVRQPQKP